MQVKKQQLESDMEQWTGSKLGKELCQGCVLSPYLFNLYAEYIMWNAGLDEAQAGIKFARRSINNLRYTDDATFMAESKEELKSFFFFNFYFFPFIFISWRLITLQYCSCFGHTLTCWWRLKRRAKKLT